MMDIAIIRGVVVLLVLVVIMISIWSWATKGRDWNALKAMRASFLMGVGSAMSLVVSHQDGTWFWIAASIGVASLVSAGVLFFLMRVPRKVGDE